MSSFNESLWIIFWEQKYGKEWGYGSPISKEIASLCAAEYNKLYPELDHLVCAPLSFFNKLLSKVGEEEAKKIYENMFPDFSLSYNPYA